MFQAKAAVVGTGFIGPVHIEALQRAGVVVQGILGTSIEKGQAIARRFGIQQVYPDYAALLADPDVNVVHLTSPNRYHFEQAALALQAGKHVLCEKPLAMDSLQSGELVQLASKTGLHAGVCYNVRYYPLCIEASQRIRSRELGEVFHVSGSYVQDWLFHPHDFNWRVLSSEGGKLRAIADIGTHWLDLIQFLCALPIRAVFADLQTVHATRFKRRGNTETFTNAKNVSANDLDPIAIDTEDYGAILFKFANGARGVMHVSQVTAGLKNCIRWEIAGSRESMAWNSQRPDELSIGHRDGPNEVLVRDPALLQSQSRTHAQYPGGHNEGFPDTFKQLFRSFYSRVDGDSGLDTPIYPTFADGHREIQICDAIVESASRQQWIELPQ